MLKIWNVMAAGHDLLPVHLRHLRGAQRRDPVGPLLRHVDYRPVLSRLPGRSPSLGSLALVFWRMPLLRSDNHLESLLSREAAFLLNNLLFLAVTFAIFWGTVFPLISEAVQGNKMTVGPPYFNQTAGPLLLLLVLMGIGPLMPWRKTTIRHLLCSFWPPALGALLAVGVSVTLRGTQPWALVGVAVCGFTATTVLLELTHGALARRAATSEMLPLALVRLVGRNRRRYGGYVVHLGIVTVSLAIVASNFYQQEQQVALKPGETTSIAGYTLGFTQLEEQISRASEAFRRRSTCCRTGDRSRSFLGKNFHRNFERQPSTTVAIRSTVFEDLYVVLAGWEPDGSASFLIFVNPMVSWLWAGGVILLLGSVISLWPERRTSFAPAYRSVSGLAVSGAS